MPNWRCRNCPIVGLLLALVWTCTATQGAQENPFDRYVKAPDDTYAWRIARTVPGDQSQTFVIHLQSQTWRTAADVDRPVWEHSLTVVKPDKPVAKVAFLMIGGGSNDRPVPETADPMIVQIARATNTVVAELRMIPNQPLIFHGDGKPRREDDLIAYAWDQYLKSGDPTWLPRLPMVKSVVRAMDAIQEMLASAAGGGVTIEKFVVAGGSKRGWTTWMTGAMDSRVAAIVPIVIDVVNVTPSMKHHAEAYGFWAKAIGDYYQHGIMQRWGDPRLDKLYELVDPYYYRDRLTMPKFIVNGSGDQFFLPDSSQFYFDDLKGEKFLRYVPNADHSLRGSDAIDSIVAFYQTILTESSRPKIEWTFSKDNSLRVTSDPPPTQVRLWYATNAQKRDFRLETIGKAYESREVQSQPDGSYVARLSAPERGWTAYFAELTYGKDGAPPLKFTTPVRVLPDRLPFSGIDLRRVPYEGNASQ